jgi:hypothetical protein
VLFTFAEILAMCDYSLEHQISRPAQVGDRLQTTGFQHSTTRGFASCSNLDVAVCLMPGTEIAFDAPVMEEGLFGLNFRPISAGATTARFRHIDEDLPHAHHDALEFPDGKIVLLTRLRPGQRATVLQLPNEKTPGKREAEIETREQITMQDA